VVLDSVGDAAPVAAGRLLYDPLLAGLQRIPAELYEAAKMDGAKSGWQTFWNITLPQLRATAVAVLILLLIAAYQAFDEFYNLLGNVNYARPPLDTSITSHSARHRIMGTVAPAH